MTSNMDMTNPIFQLYEAVRGARNSQGQLISEPFLQLPSRKDYPDYYHQISQPICLHQIKYEPHSVHMEHSTTLNSAGVCPTSVVSPPESDTALIHYLYKLLVVIYYEHELLGLREDLNDLYFQRLSMLAFSGYPSFIKDFHSNLTYSLLLPCFYSHYVTVLFTTRILVAFFQSQRHSCFLLI